MSRDVTLPVALRGAPRTPPPVMPSVPGYELLEELGRGGMGVVYKARQLGLNRLVALKMIRAGAGAVTAERVRFRAEAEAIARLRHPHIVQIHEIGEADGQPYLALEYVAGGSLARQLAEALPTPQQAAELTLLLARAVHDTHRAGVLHRDIKPGNVLLATDGSPRIGDFGLARLIDQDSNLTQTGMVLGTPAYMAPEQANGTIQDVGPAADVYALGAVLYEMLTGRPPFRGSSALDTLDQVRNREPVAPGQLRSGIPRDLETICLKCLRKEPARRYSSAGELADDCSAFLQRKPIKARPAGPLERTMKWVRRRPVIAGLSSSIVVLVVCGFVGALIYQSRLRTALATADRQRTRAEANYQKIQEAVDGLLVEVGNKDLEDVPEMEEARARLLERALQLFQKLLDDRDNPDPAVRRQVCRTLRHTADIYLMLGRGPEAERDARRGLELAEQLVAEFPDDVGDRQERAWAVFRLACVVGAAGRSPEACEYYGRAIALTEELPEEAPERRATLVRCCNQMGVTQMRDHPVEAEAFFRRALALLADPTARVPPEVASLRLGVQFNLGVLAQSQGKDAVSAYREALTVLEPAVATARRVGNEHAMLADVYHNLGLLVAAKEPKAAEEYLVKACDLHKQLFTRNPRITKLRRDLASDHEALANVFHGANRLEEAVAHLLDAVALRAVLVGETVEHPDDAVRLANDHLVVGMIRGGQKRPVEAEAAYQKAVDVLEPLVKRQGDTSAYEAGLGTAFLFLAYLSLEKSERNEAIARSSRAIELLERVHAKTPSDAVTRVKLRGAHLLRASAVFQVGRLAEALADQARAAELDEPPARGKSP